MYYQPLIVKEIPYRTHVGSASARGFLHWHSEMELLICLSGQMTVDLENRSFSLCAYDALILPGYAAHSAKAAVPGTSHVAINFGYNLLKKGYHSIQNTCLFLPAAEDSPLRQPVDELTRLFRCDDRSEWRVRANLFLLCAVLQESAGMQPPDPDLQNRIRRLESIYAVLDHVAKHYPEKITVEDMANLAGYAKTYFCRQFKSITGIPFYRYLTCYRVSIACMLMTDSHYSMAAVSERTGFSTQALFCRAFKEVTGMTPTQFLSLPPEEKVLTWIN